MNVDNFSNDFCYIFLLLKGSNARFEQSSIDLRPQVAIQVSQHDTKPDKLLQEIQEEKEKFLSKLQVFPSSKCLNFKRDLDLPSHLCDRYAQRNQKVNRIIELAAEKL